MYCFAEYAGGGGMTAFLAIAIGGMILAEAVTYALEISKFSIRGALLVGIMLGFALGVMAMATSRLS